MENSLRPYLRLLIIVAILFLIAIIFYLFYCKCYRCDKEHLRTELVPLNNAQVGPHEVSGGRFPPFEIQGEASQHNNDRRRIVPTGSIRGTLSPSQNAVKFLEIKKKANEIPGGGGAGDPVVFSDYDAFGNTITSLGIPPDVNGARGGNVVLYTFNTSARLSTDGGNTYTTLNPTAVFPSAASRDAAGNLLDNGLCCDQIIQYVPSIDRFIWLMQFCGSGTGGCLTGINRVRIASASPQQIINSNGTSWTYWDLLSATFNLGITTMDYPDLSVGNNFLYFSSDAVGTGLLVVRIPLNEIRDNQTINMNYTNPSDGSVAYGGHISQNTGDAVYWAGHDSSNQIRVFTMREGNNNYSWNPIKINSWPNGIISSIAKDGTTDWLNFLGTNFPGNAVLGITRRNNEVWFGWTASQGGGFPRAQIQIVKIDITNYTLIQQTQVWNPDYAFAFPSLATNANNEVGISLAWGGNQNWGNNAVGIMGDFIVWYPELSDTAITRWGDYVSVRQSNPNSLLFEGTGYAVQKNSSFSTGYRFDPYIIQFGRNSVVNPVPVVK